MSKFQILCVTMNQTDFSKINQMNIHSDVIFANQSDTVSFNEIEFEGYNAKMITTNTRGVGKNRNLSLVYASGDICLLSDDDMRYTSTYEEDIIEEFRKHPDADVMIFNIDSNDEKRKQKYNSKTRKLYFYNRMPYGAPRIAFRRSSWQKSNVWFTTLFGGGAKYTNGEDSVFLHDLKKSKLSIYVSSVNIGMVDMSDSCWFKGANEEFYFNKGAYCAALHPYTKFIWRLYFCIRVKSKLSFSKKMDYFNKGINAYRKGKEWNDFIK